MLDCLVLHCYDHTHISFKYVQDDQAFCVCIFTLEEDNLQGWLFAEDDGIQLKKQKHPLLLKQMPVVMSKLQEFKVRLFFFSAAGGIFAHE